MHDCTRPLKEQRDPSLGAALRGLPQSVPQPDAWPRLAAALARRARPRRRRYAIALTLAAGLALALLIPRGAIGPPAQNDAATNSRSAAATEKNPANPASRETSQLRQRSQTLERWIAAVSANAPQDSRDLMAAVEMEDLIGLVDVQLGAVREDADARPLWRQRVALLEDLATIRVGAFAIAANDNPSNGTHAPLNRVN